MACLLSGTKHASKKSSPSSSGMRSYFSRQLPSATQKGGELKTPAVADWPAGASRGFLGPLALCVCAPFSPSLSELLPAASTAAPRAREKTDRSRSCSPGLVLRLLLVQGLWLLLVRGRRLLLVGVGVCLVLAGHQACEISDLLACSWATFPPPPFPFFPPLR